MNSSLRLFSELFEVDYSHVEKDVSHREGSYQGLTPEALYTSAEDLFNIFQHPLVKGDFLDIGCGTGKASVIYGHMFPERKSIGIDFEEARLNFGKKVLEKLPIDNVVLIHGDLLVDAIPIVDLYFLYFPTGKVLDRVLNELYKMKRDFRLIAIESHGDLLARLGLENWLTLKAELPLISQRHVPHVHLFERNFEVRSSRLEPFELSFIEKFLFIKNQDEIWIGESLGMEWASGDRFELITPPRTIFWRDVQKVETISAIDKKYHEAIRIRRLGELQIRTSFGNCGGFIRKIIVYPTFHLEISGGEKVEWSEILTIHQGSTICYSSS